MRPLIYALSALFLVLPTLAHAQNYPNAQSPYVNDFANLIDAETSTRIEQTLKELRADKGIEMTVVTIGSVKDYDSTQSVPDFATGLFNAWGVGHAERNDGIVFLTAVHDREMFIALGSGYPPVYDDRMDRVFTYHVKPYFVKDDYANGIEVGVLETIKRTSNNYTETAPTSPGKGLFDQIVHYSVIAFMSVAGFFVIKSAFGKKLNDFSYKWRRCPNCNRRELVRTRKMITPATYETEGRETIYTQCSNCNYGDEKIRTISKRSRSSSRSGGGGFGGGSSSGGGGGGRW